MSKASIGPVLGSAVLLTSLAMAQQPSTDAAPPLTGKPAFVPGLYETESRNSAFRELPGAGAAKARVCIASADYEAFRRETLAQYLSSPDFLKSCNLSDSRDLADGFAFALDCKESKIVLTFHFSRDLVSSTTQTRTPSRPQFASEILTLSRRVGECEGQPKPGRAS